MEAPYIYHNTGMDKENVKYTCMHSGSFSAIKSSYIISKEMEADNHIKPMLLVSERQLYDVPYTLLLCFNPYIISCMCI